MSTPKKKIVWIEDDTDIINDVVRPLERGGYLIERFYTVKEALDNIEKLRACDLILLDLIIPPGTDERFGHYPGMHLLRTFRNDFHLQQPVIVLSVVADAEVFQDLKDLNAEIENKPILPSKLKRLVEQVLGV
ncbi:MAG: response regulator [Anaerolineae bacterium]|jgi:CheY-like chemotaxis protein|nr:response regulator [Anaerolineae bacterium]MBT7070780.1 response regulator [Anaerolineae bacterium]MBT7325024.1 response regulator [Anaerolineae bacterium]